MEQKELQDKQFKRMTTVSVQRLVGSLAVPTIISMMVTNIYNMVDTAFVGTLGTSQSGAVGIVFGYMSILQAVGFMCGMGSGCIMSRRLGAKDVESASNYSSLGFFMSLGLGAIIGILSYIFLEPLLVVLGSTSTISVYAKVYIKFIIVSAPFMTASLSLNNLLRYEGRAKLGTAGLLTGAILNICGDALFMFVLNMGIAGAGLSTAIAQTISFCILLFMFLSGKTQTKISVKRAYNNIGQIGNVLASGFPSLVRQSLNSISTMLLNSFSAGYGDSAVAAMSIVSRISFFVMSLAIGMGQGFQPVSSFNYGAGKYERVKKAYWFTFIVAEILVCIIVVPVFFNAPSLIRIFRDDSEVVIYGVRALRLQCITGPLIPLSMMTEMGFQSTGQKIYATISSSLRSGIVFIPTLIILACVRGMKGIQEAQPVAFAISFVISIFFARIFLQNLEKRENV